MINSELLKEAIADAKAVRVTAYANAKASLQERFEKRFEAVFAEKLQKESEEEEEGLQEVEAPNQVSGTGGEAKGPKTKAVSKGQPKKKSDASTNWKVVHMGQGPTDVPKADNKIDEAAEEEEESKNEACAEEEEESKLDETSLTSEDLDEIIKELEAEVTEEEQGKQVQEPVDVGPTEPDAEGDDEEGETPEPEVGGAEDAEEPEGKLPPKFDDQTGAPLPGTDVADTGMPGDVGTDDAMGGLGGEEEVPMPGAEVPGAPVGQVPPQVPPQVPQVPPVPGSEEQEEIGLEELLAALNEEAEEEEEEGKMDEVENHGVPKAGNESKATVKGYPKTAPEKTSPGSTQVAGKNHNISGKGNIGTGAVAGGLKEVTKYKTALSEAYKTIEFLRGQINEVNLLNAKLLYTNKLFKEFATVIDESYRMKIVEAFDLTKSVREVKLAYALLAESLNFGSKRVIASQAKPTPKVDPAKKAIAKQITEGLASKPVGSTKPASVITENADMMVSRLQKLAGIKKPIVESKK